MQLQLFQIMNGDTEILIPILDQIIEKVDRENKTIYISAPAGLIDIYLQQCCRGNNKIRFALLNQLKKEKYIDI